MAQASDHASQILEYLEAGIGITAEEARSAFGCGRLAARIFDLRQLGFAIETRSIPTECGGTAAQYYLKPKSAAPPHADETDDDLPF